MIKVTELCRTSDGKNILDNINLNIEPGCFAAVIGHNGSGKSTLVRHFNALIIPEKGCVTVDDMNMSDRKHLYDIRKNVGMVFQNPESQSVTSVVEDDIAFGPENIGLDEVQKRIDNALHICGIEHLRNRDISSLSGGQKQLVAIAGIIAMQPKYMIFDEATSMLDPVSGKLVFDCVMKLKNELNIAVIWITHNMEEARFADRVIEIKNGKIISDGIPDKVLPKREIHNKTKIPKAFDFSGIEPALTMENVSFSYHTPTGKIGALKDISVSIPKNKITAVTGKTGSGKSTLAEILSGITEPDSGKVIRLGECGIVFQFPVFFEDTVYDEIAYAPKQNGCVNPDWLVKQISQALGITDELLKKSPFRLSGGEQKLVSLASVISAEPDIVILDEPTAGLDSVQKKNVFRLIQNLKSAGKTIVFITHSTEDAVTYADNIIHVDDGKISETHSNGGDSHAS